MMNVFSLSGKRVLLTGASGGIGSAVASFFLQAGAKMVLSGTSDAKLESLSKTLTGEFFTKSCNLSDSTDISNLVLFALEKLGGIDVLICNAGITADGLVMMMKENDFDKVIDVNLKSSFLLTKAVLKPMIKQRSGRLIYISSVVGQTGNAGQANYVASKSGLIGFAKSVACEVASRGITANCIAPGFIKSQMTDVLNDAQTSAILSKIPMGKYGEGSDIANAAGFLACDASSYITGHTLSVNGGMFME